MNDLQTTANKTLSYLLTNLDRILVETQSHAPDIAKLYKLPMLFIVSGHQEVAQQVLSFIQTRYLTDSGDLLTQPATDFKSAKPEYNEFYTYTNGWIVRAAQKLNYQPLSKLGYQFIEPLLSESGQGSLTHAPGVNDDVTDVLTTAHHGLICLERGLMQQAHSAGQYLIDMYNKQPELDKRFYLRSSRQGQLLTQFSGEQAPLYTVETDRDNQLYFMLGYPCAYLALLYQATGSQLYLDTAVDYFQFVLNCQHALLSLNSHKISWAASLLYRLDRPEPQYLNAIATITDQFIKQQDNQGLWYTADNDPIKVYDQSAEIACWFVSIQYNLQTAQSSSNI